MRALSRVAAGLAGLATIPFLLFGIGWLWLMTASTLQSPGPCTGDQVWCPPKSAAEQRELIGWMLGIGALTGLVAAAGVAGVAWALAGRVPRPRRLALIPAGAVLAVAILTEPWWTG